MDQAEIVDTAPKAAARDGLYPRPHSPLFDFEATGSGAAWIDELAEEAVRRLNEHTSPSRIVHTDWRGDNIRVDIPGERLVAVFDWDSVRAEPEAVALGGVAAMHSVDWSGPGDPYFATGDECIDFARTVEQHRHAAYSVDEWRAIRAAIVLGWCYTARCEHARASVGDDRPQFRMRERLRTDGRRLLG